MNDMIKKTFRAVGRRLPTSYLKSLQNRVLFHPEIRERGLVANGSPPIFKAVFFELRSKCNGRCGFCPVNVFVDPRQDRTMPLEVFESAIDQLVELEFSGRVAFHNNNEPLIVKDLEKYVEIATRKLPAVHEFHISTNGLALTKKKALQLLDAGITRFTVNVYNDDLKAPLPERVKEFQTIVSEFNRRKEKSRPVLLEVYRRLENEVLDNKGGHSPNKKTLQDMPAGGFCLQPFTILCIDPDGAVSLCCNDNFTEAQMGDVKVDKLKDIWEGTEFAHYRQALLRGDREILEMCKECDYLGIGPRPGLKKQIVYFLSK